jgi:hypothetical protein
MKPLEAARLLYINGEIAEAETILRALWGQVDLVDGEASFELLCAMLEVGVARDPHFTHQFLEGLISGEGSHQEIWETRTLSQQGVLFEWHGHVSFLIGESAQALDSLTRAASLGCDHSMLWMQLASLFVDNGELDLGLRYAKRSLQLYKQLDLSFGQSQDEVIGAFGGKHPTGFEHNVETFMGLLLRSTKLAKNHKSLKVVRELIVEMIHQFPEEVRLPKIRLLVERNIVSGALQQPTLSI